jgi:hypothetical protein
MPVNSEQDCCWLQRKAGMPTVIRRFESCRPSQAVRRSATLPKKREIGPEIPAFCPSDPACASPLRQPSGRELSTLEERPYGNIIQLPDTRQSALR